MTTFKKPVFTDGHQSLLNLGALSFKIAYGQYFYLPKMPAGFDKSHIDVGVMAQQVPTLTPGQTILMDIEEFDPKTELEMTIQNLATAARVWRQLDPTATLGIYKIIPDIIYSAPTKLVKTLLDEEDDADKVSDYLLEIQEWRDRNNILAETLIPLVDYVCPCLYAVEDWPYWKVYANTQIKEARRIAQNKLVYPIIWPTYRSKKAIPEKIWETMCDWLVSHSMVDGVTVYVASGYPTSTNWERTLIKAFSDLDFRLNMRY